MKSIVQINKAIASIFNEESQRKNKRFASNFKLNWY